MLRDQFWMKHRKQDLVALATVLRDILKVGEDYKIRNAMVLTALALATNAGIPSGIRFDKNEPKWPIIYIMLPTGQVSWHVPEYEGAWDGHTTDEKNIRCVGFIKQVLP